MQAAEVVLLRKNVPILMPDRIGLSENKRHDWVVDLPTTVTLKEAMEPSYWAHVASQMEPFDHIEVRSEDGSWVAYLLVVFCESNYAKVILDREIRIEADTEAPLESIKHRVLWKGPHLKFAVIRVSDSQILSSGHKTKQEGIGWMQEHERTLGR